VGQRAGRQAERDDDLRARDRDARRNDGDGTAKSTLDGKRTLTCDLRPRTAQLVHRFRVGNNVRITCDDLALTNIVHV
jgi:hypothetical protein